MGGSSRTSGLWGPECSLPLPSDTGAITAATFAAGAITAAAVAADANAAVAAAVFAYTVETGTTFLAATRVIGAVVAGELTGAGTGTEAFKSIAAASANRPDPRGHHA